METKMENTDTKSKNRCDGLTENEVRLAAKMQSECNIKGMERCPEVTAVVLYDLGLEYSRKTEFMASVQASGLLYGAVLRNEVLREQVERQINGLGTDILSRYGITRDFQIVEESKRLKLMVNAMRSQIAEKLEVILNLKQSNKPEQERVLAVEALMNWIADEYTTIMRHVSERCVYAMGDPLCEFTQVGMGSLARREITPYSDFENIILLDDSINDLDDKENVINYFRSYAALFHIIVVGLQETPLRLLGVPCLNDFFSGDKTDDWFWDKVTPCGIQFDSNMPNAGKHPLGVSVELIKSVSDMSDLLDGFQHGGDRLANMLALPCFVAGSSAVYESFCKKTRNKLKQIQENLSFRLVVKQECLTELSAFNLFKAIPRQVYKTDVKRFVYRAVTMILSMLGKLFNIEDPTCFGIINALLSMGLIAEETASRLKFSVAVTCEVRVRAVMECKEQDNFVERAPNVIPYLEGSEKSTGKVWGDVGLETIREFFLIAFGFQSDLTAVLESWDGNTKLRLLKIKFDETKNWLVNSLLSIQFNNDDTAIKELKESDSSDSNQMYMSCHMNGMLLHKAGKVGEALEKFKTAKENAERADVFDCETERQCTLSWLLHWIGDCHRIMGQFQSAKDSFNESLDICRGLLNRDTGKWEKHLKNVEFNNLVSFATLYQARKDPMALSFLMQAEGKCKEIHGHPSTEWFDIQNNIGTCHLQACNFERAYEVKKRALDAYYDYEDAPIADEYTVNAHSNIGDCLYEMKRYEEAAMSYSASQANAKALFKSGRAHSCVVAAETVRSAKCENKLNRNEAALELIVNCLGWAQQCKFGAICQSKVQCTNVCLDIEMEIVEKLLLLSQGSDDMSQIPSTFVAAIQVYIKLREANVSKTAKLKRSEELIHSIAHVMNSSMQTKHAQRQDIVDALSEMHNHMNNGINANKIAKIIGDYFIRLNQITKSNEWYMRGNKENVEYDMPTTTLELLDSLLIALTAFRTKKNDLGFQHAILTMKSAMKLKNYGVIQKVIDGVLACSVEVIETKDKSSCTKLGLRLAEFSCELETLEPSNNFFKSRMLIHNVRARSYVVTQHYDLAGWEYVHIVRQLREFVDARLTKELTVISLVGFVDVLEACRSMAEGGNPQFQHLLDGLLITAVDMLHFADAAFAPVNKFAKNLCKATLNSIEATIDQPARILQILDRVRMHLDDDYSKVEVLVSGCIQLLSKHPGSLQIVEGLQHILSALQSIEVESSLVPLVMLELSKLLCESDGRTAADLANEAYFKTFVSENQDLGLLSQSIHAMTKILTLCMKKGEYPLSILNAAELLETTLSSLDGNSVVRSEITSFYNEFMPFLDKCISD